MGTGVRGRVGVYATVLTTTADRPSAQDEVKAILDFIKDKSYKQVLLVGQSLGAVRAPQIANELREERKRTGEGIEARGIVVVNPGGMYEQSLVRLAWNTIHEKGVKMGLLKEKLKEQPGEKAVGPDSRPTEESVKTISAQEDADLDEGIKEKRHDGWNNGIRRAWSELKELIRPNEAWKEVTEPVVVVLGQHDPMFSYKEMGIEPSREGETGILSKRSHQLRRLLQLSEKDNSEDNNKVLFGNRIGSHVGLYMYRFKGLAHATLAQLERIQREKVKREEAKTQNSTNH